MSKNTIALIAGLVLLSVFLAALAMNTSQPASSPTPTPIQKSPPTPTAIPKSKLFMSPNPVSLAANQATVTVDLDSMGQDVTSVQMEISYNPRILSLVSITPSSLFTKGVPILNTIDKNNGRISYAVGLSPEQSKSIHEGQSEVATLIFTRLPSASASASTDVTFLPKSVVSAKGLNQSVLGQTTGTTILLTPQAAIPASLSGVPIK